MNSEAAFDHDESENSSIYDEEEHFGTFVGLCQLRYDALLFHGDGLLCAFAWYSATAECWNFPTKAAVAAQFWFGMFCDFCRAHSRYTAF